MLNFKFIKELNLIKDKIEIYTILRENIFHLNGVPKFAIEKTKRTNSRSNVTGIFNFMN